MVGRREDMEVRVEGEEGVKGEKNELHVLTGHIISEVFNVDMYLA